MTPRNTRPWWCGAILVLLVSMLGIAQPSFAQAPIIQPGAPGEPSRQITAEEASDLASLQFTDGDVKFMQGMISHHAQALDMTALVTPRSNSTAILRLAERIAISQDDEITMMQEWLESRNLEVTSRDAHRAAGAVMMPGMVSAEDMARLDAAEGVDFDRLFLALMITHHQGALTMVDTLLDQPGTAQDSVLYGFTADITADQGIEIDRMDAMLAGLIPDPRVNLAAGFLDAGQAALNMELVVALPKPDGFFDPNNPSGLPREPEPSTADESAEPVSEDAEDDRDEPGRPSLLNFGNTDLAFAGNVLFAGNYHGFGAYGVDNPLAPELVASVVCPGGQGDVSVVGNLLIISVEQTRGRLDCGLQGVAEPVSGERFRGIRIFDISDLRLPRQVGAVQTCRGSHTHTVVTDPDDQGNIYVYGSGTSSVRPGDELDGCVDAAPGNDANTALFRIDVIQIPVARPAEARIVSRPYVFEDPDSGAIAGLWRGGDHGPGTQTTRATTQCHDITAYPEIGLAAGACSGNGILLDISDPTNPVRIDQVIDPGFSYWHSATFNNDGTKVIFTDEWGGGSRPRCRASDPRDWGADAIFDIVDRRLEFRSYFKLPAPQTEQENCVAHNGSLVPVPGRDIFVQAWYQGGISVIDFTDSTSPQEIAFFDRGPISSDDLIMGGYWSAYWYRGFIYGTEIARGLDVLRLLPSEYVTANELAAAALVMPAAANAQQQRRDEWPAHPMVARAYLDQLLRNDAISGELADTVTTLLDQIGDTAAATGQVDTAVAAPLNRAATTVALDAELAGGRDRARLESLATTLRSLAELVQ